MNNKVTKIFLLSVGLLTQQSNTTAFQKILLALGAIPAFHIAKFVHFFIMEEKILHTVNKNVAHFEHSFGTRINSSKEYRNFENERMESTKKHKYSKVLKSLHEYNRCLETAIERNTASQNTFNACNEYGLEFLK